MHVIIPEMQKVPEGATQEDRQKMYDDYCAEMASLNPRHFNPDGSQKSIAIHALSVGLAVGFITVFIIKFFA